MASWFGGFVGLVFSSVYKDKANTIITFASLILPSFGTTYKNLPNLGKIGFNTFLFSFLGSLLGNAFYTSFTCFLPCVFVSICAVGADGCLAVIEGNKNTTIQIIHKTP